MAATLSPCATKRGDEHVFLCRWRQGCDRELWHSGSRDAGSVVRDGAVVESRELQPRAVRVVAAETNADANCREGDGAGLNSL